MQYDSSPWQNDLFGLTSNQGAILTGNCFGISIKIFLSQLAESDGSWLALKLMVENVLNDVQEHMSPE